MSASGCGEFLAGGQHEKGYKVGKNEDYVEHINTVLGKRGRGGIGGQTPTKKKFCKVPWAIFTPLAVRSIFAVTMLNGCYL